MKPFLLVTLITLLPLAFTTAFAGEQHKAVDWPAFSKNLTVALSSDNNGLKQSALQQIIKYHQSLDMKDAALAVMRIYRNHPDFQTRRLALTALPSTDSRLVIGFLRRAVEFEKSPVLHKQIMFILENAGEAKVAAASTASATDSNPAIVR